MKRIVAWIGSCGATLDDTEEDRLLKATVAAVAISILPSAAIWGSVYLLVDRPLAAVMPYAYIVVAWAALAILQRTKRVIVPRTLILVAMVALPFTLQWVLGGYGGSGAVAIWSLMVPAMAFMFGAPPGRWVIVLVTLLVLSGVFDTALAERFDPLPPAMITVFFVLNTVAVGVTYLVAVLFFTRERALARAVIQVERERADALLLNVLPEEIAERLKAGETLIADGHPEVTILFADIVGFTSLTADLTPEAVVEQLGQVFGAVDGLVQHYGLVKIKTIGDGYEVIAGAPTARVDHAEAVAELALDLFDHVAGLPLGDSVVDLRVGIDTGRAVGAVIGSHKFTYDVWGDAVNTANRMESHGVAGRIQVTDRFRRALGDRYEFESRGEIEVRGKGAMETWFLVGRNGR